MEVNTFEELFEKHNIITWAGNKEKVKSLCIEYAKQIALAACEEQKNLCAEDLPYRTTKLTIYCVLNTPPPTEFINQLLNR